MREKVDPPFDQLQARSPRSRPPGPRARAVQAHPARIPFGAWTSRSSFSERAAPCLARSRPGSRKTTERSTPQTVSAPDVPGLLSSRSGRDRDRGLRALEVIERGVDFLPPHIADDPSRSPRGRRCDARPGRTKRSRNRLVAVLAWSGRRLNGRSVGRPSPPPEHSSSNSALSLPAYAPRSLQWNYKSPPEAEVAVQNVGHVGSPRPRSREARNGRSSPRARSGWRLRLLVRQLHRILVRGLDHPAIPVLTRPSVGPARMSVSSASRRWRRSKCQSQTSRSSSVIVAAKSSATD